MLRPLWTSLAVSVCGCLASSLHGLTVAGYSAAANDRFASGFPNAPVPNSDAAFIGQGLDFSGISWSTTTYESSTYKGFGMLSPRHFLTAQHYEYTRSDGSGSLNQRTQGIRILGRDGAVWSTTGVDSVDNLDYGIRVGANNGVTDYDLAVGTLGETVAAPVKLSRTAVLDLHPSSTTDSLAAYSTLPVFLYGRGASTGDSPRIAATTPDAVGSVNSDPKQTVLRTTQSDATFVLGDSGSPALYAWQNPNGQSELTVLGVNSAVDDTNGFNFVSFLPLASAIGNAQAVMNPDGFAMRLVGDPGENTWQGDSSTDIESNSAWGISSGPGGGPFGGGGTGATSDEYGLFDAASAASRSVDVSTDYNLRGVYFKSTAASGDGFSFAGGADLTIGRGGITNYDADSQVFTTGLALGAPQYWSIEAGSVNLSTLATNGHLLEIGGSGTVEVSGAISGNGALALSDGSLFLSGNSSYTGPTWVHGGTLEVNGDIGSSSALTVDRFGRVQGSGRIPPIDGGGLVSPGNSPGILTTSSVNPSSGLAFDFEFTATGEPAFANASSSVNDLLRLTGGTPFGASMTSANRIRIFLNAGGLADGQIYEGGFFTDQASDFLGAIEHATFEFYVPDSGGDVSFEGQSYSLYDGSARITLSSEPQSADFGSGSVSGRIMRLSLTFPPAAPGSFSAAAVSSSAIDLSWTDNSANEEGFLIERRPSGGSYAEIAVLGADTSSFADDGLTDGTLYEYRITAFNPAGDSAAATASAATLSQIENWRLLNFGTTENAGEAADSFDFEPDSLANLIEYMLGTDPKAFSAPPLDPLSLAETGELSFDWRLDSSYDFALGFTDDIAAGFSYDSSATLDAGASANFELVGVEDLGDGFEHRTYRLRSTAAGSQAFVRLRVQLAE